MEIIKKRGLKKTRITHNKKILVWIIILLAILAVIIYFIFALGGKKSPDNPSDDTECKMNSDCVKVQLRCCPCSSGGEEKCVPSSEKDKYNEILANCSPMTVCSQVYSCVIKSCVCSENKCKSEV